jgi:glycosyltransferase involved in cell wall biosynthesis
MRKVIWLCSWYPNETDQFRGDFVQRQAKAVSQFASVSVFHVVITDFTKKESRVVSDSLTEHIQYVRQKNKVFDYFTIKKIHTFFLNDYITASGNPDLVHVQIPMNAGLVALRWKKKYNIPFVVTEHYGIYNTLVKDSFQKRNIFFRYFTIKILKKAKFFLPVSNSLGNDVNREVIDIAFQAVPNVVDTNVFNYYPKRNNGKFSFIHISNLDVIKNPLGILAAIEKLVSSRQDFKVNFVGCINETFIEIARQKKLLNNFIFIQKEISYREIASINLQADAGLLFSHSESQSCVVLEWLCCGLPVISSSVGGVVELLNETNGILVTDNDIEDLAQSMSNMIDNYSKYNRQEISIAAIEKYSYDAVGKQIAQVYENVLAKI